MARKNIPTEERINSYLLCADTGKGKSYTANKLLHEEYSHIPEDNRFLICPSFYRDIKKTLHKYFTNKDLVFLTMGDEFIPALIQLIDKDRAEVEQKGHYKIDKKGKRVKIPRPPDSIPPYNEFLLMFDDCNQFLRKPGAIYSDLDLLFTNNRHLPLNIIVTQHNFKSSPPCIRKNARQMWLWSTPLGELKQICEEQNELKNNRDFYDYFRFITKPKYSYFHINNKKQGIHKYDDNPVTFKEFKLLRDAGEIDSDDE